ncbi:MAG: hypothetical protein M3R25_03060 [Bacteroidota bacterium]|nr:hypothetical protein [Bacteroidota bacterium]
MNTKQVLTSPPYPTDISVYSETLLIPLQVSWHGISENIGKSLLVNIICRRRAATHLGLLIPQSSRGQDVTCNLKNPNPFYSRKYSMTAQYF